MKKTKIAAYIITTSLEILLLVAAYIINYFARKRIGMNRFMVYMNQTIEKEYTLEIWITVAITCLIILTAIVAVFWLRIWQKVTHLEHGMNILMILMTTFAALFIYVKIHNVLNAYYIMAFMIMGAAYLQILKTLAALLMRRNV